MFHKVLPGIGHNHIPSAAIDLENTSKILRWTIPACIKERLSTSAHTCQSPTKKRKRETTETNEDPAGCQPCDPACA